MASSLNKVLVIGNLGKDPEVRYMPSGGAVANFSIACSDSWTDKQGQRQERTEWVRIVAFNKTAELCGEYLAKGRQVFIEGRMQTREYQDRDNNKRYITEVVANNVQFLGSRSDAQAGAGAGANGGAPRSAPARDNRAPSYGGGGGGGRSEGGSQQSPDQGYDYGPPPSEDDVPFHHVPREKKSILPL